MDQNVVILLVFCGALTVSIACVSLVISSLIEICLPNEILVLSGSSQNAEGLGYRIVRGGRAFRIPIVETVDRMSLQAISVDATVRGAYSKGGVPINMKIVASVAITGDAKKVGNAVERFLGRGVDEIGTVATETIEGHARGLVANHAPEEIHGDRLRFANELIEGCTEDFGKLGLDVDVLLIDEVSDDSGYLEAIGRKAIAERGAS